MIFCVTGTGKTLLDRVKGASPEKKGAIQLEDSQIVDLYLARNETALTETAQKYGSLLRAVSRRITQDEPIAEECENDTYLEAWNLIPPHEPRDYLSAFLSRIVRSLSINRCVERNRLKRKATVYTLSDELEECLSSGDDVAKELESKELAECVSRFLREQPTEKRVIFLHRYYYCEGIAAIANRFDTTGGRIKQILFRMRQKLRERLIKEGYSV